MSETTTATSLPAQDPKPPRGAPRRRSSRTKWRILILVLVHIAAAIHFAHWYYGGETLTPIEPSESMQTLENGLVNAGFIFFVIAILATMIFGRFFCGWACHLVAYQDAASWLLGKLGIKPKPIRSRLMMWAPLVVALYMFVWPTLTRWVRTDVSPEWQAHFETSRFWDSFAGPWMALVTLFVCGGLIVYWMGSKGFCTYGCPYGGFFGVADKIAPGRIRVTDACKGCRHCTDACTSNVLVHQEVLTHGNVVDPGCMKCLDCVDVCPENALYFGFGKPGILGKNGPKKKAASTRAHKQAGFVDAVDLATFVGTTGLASWWIHDAAARPLPWWFIVATAALIGFVVTRERHAKGKVFDFSFGEELVMALVFLLSSQLVFRGLYAHVPFLLSLGLGAITALMTIVTWRLLTPHRSARGGDLKWQHHQLRLGGRWTGAGRNFAIFATCWGAFTGHSAFVQYHKHQIDHNISTAVPLAQADREPFLDRALSHIESFDAWALFDDPVVRKEEGNIAYNRGDLERAERAITRSLALNPKQIQEWGKLVQAQLGRQDLAGAYGTLVKFSDQYPQEAQSVWGRMHEVAMRAGDRPFALKLLEDYVQRYPADQQAGAALEQARKAR